MAPTVVVCGLSVSTRVASLLVCGISAAVAISAMVLLTAVFVAHREGHSGKTYVANDLPRGSQCDHSPCYNGGTCTANLTAAVHGASASGQHMHVCECPAGYFGRDCTSVDYCIRLPCQNDGKCRVEANGFNCTCAPGFNGRACEITDHCASSPCNNHGICFLSMRGFAFSCQCNMGWTGPECEYLDNCASNPCQNHGACFNVGPHGYGCDCTASFTGSLCQFVSACYMHNGSSLCTDGQVCHDLQNRRHVCLDQ